VGIAAAAALIVTAAALTVALAAVTRTHAASRELSQRLVPAAAAAEVLLKDYTVQQTGLRDYLTSGRPTDLAPLRSAGRQIPGHQARLGALIHTYRRMPAQLAAVVAAQRAWFANVARPQLSAAARGNFARARAMQLDIPHIRPYVLAVRSRVAALQAQITSQQQLVTDRLTGWQSVLVTALLLMCGLVVVVAAGGVAAVRHWLLSPFNAFRGAVETVAAGSHDSPIPVSGPGEFADLARSTELMRTRLVAALAERERAEQGFRRLFETAPDASLAVRQDGSIVMVNTQAERLFGYSADELAGQQVEILIPEASRAVHVSHRRNFFANGKQRSMGGGLELTAVRSDGSEFPVEISLSVLPTDRGQIATATIRDISERLAIQTERERLVAEAETERAQRRLQQSQKMESLGQLVGGVAHDFNNLLNVIAGYTELVSEQITDLAASDSRLQPLAADMEHVRNASQQASRLTRQLLTFARHDVIKPEILDLNDSIKGAAELLRRTLGEHIDLVITASPGLWPVKADRSQLEQVLVNLAINARDAMPRGGKLAIDSSNIDVDASYAASRPDLRIGRYVRLRVSDSGTGMDRATVDRVFEPFFTTKPKGHGTGLGLATVYGITTQAGGTIQIYSEPGLGTTVSVMLPASHETAQPQPAGALPVPGHGNGRGHGETILLVEDEGSLRELANRILSRNGYRVCDAATGRDAVERARNPDQRIDLLLTDVVMPEMLGNEVAAHIHELRPDLPVLYMSGYAQPILDTHGATHGQMDIVEKPFTESTLLARISRALSGHRPAPTQDLTLGHASAGPVSPGPVSPGPVSPGPVSPRPVSPGPVSPGPVPLQAARLWHEAITMGLKWAAALRDTVGNSHDSRIIRRSCDCMRVTATPAPAQLTGKPV